MTYLICCTYEVGGLPYRMAEVLNRKGVKTLYISLAEKTHGHDSTSFHHDHPTVDWDLTAQIGKRDSLSKGALVRLLGRIRKEYQIHGCLATGTECYLLKEAGFNYKYWSYGSDLDQFCFSPIWPRGYPAWKKPLVYTVFLMVQRRKARTTIRYADAVMISSYQQETLEKLFPEKPLFFLPHVMKIPEIALLERERLRSHDELCREMDAGYFFFSPTRHYWADSNRNLADNKANDVILKSFQKYLETKKDEPVKLILVRKGPDVDASISLAEELGIDNRVMWADEMKREKLNRFYQGATLCFGQFGTPVLTYAAIEAMANACACITYTGTGRPHIPFYREPPPVLSTKNPDEIAFLAKRLVTDKIYHRELSQRLWHWVNENCNEDKFVESFLHTFA